MTPRKDRPATQKDLYQYAMISARARFEILAELRALRQMVIEHLAQTLAFQEAEGLPGGGSDEEMPILEQRYFLEADKRLSALASQMRTELAAQVEDIDPTMAVWLDSEATGERGPDPQMNPEA